MNLIIDIGNTQTKAAVFYQQQLREIFTASVANREFILTICKKYPDISSAIVSSVAGTGNELIEVLESEGMTITVVNEHNRLPIENK